VVNVEGHQEGAVRGFNPKKLGNNCYNIQFAFCDELKAYITGFVRSGNTYTANGAAEMIKEIMSYLKDEGLEITFRMDSGYFDDDIITTIESFGCTYVIKGKEYPALASQVTAPSISFIKGEEGRETTEIVTKLDTWDKDRRFVVSRILKPEKDRSQLSFLDGSDFEYFYFVTNTELPSEKVVIAYEKRGNAENYIKEAKYDRYAPSRSDKGYGRWTPVTPILLGQRSHFSVDDVGLQFVFVVQDGLCKWNGIPTANQNVQIEIYLPCREDYPNCQKCDHETFRKISLSRDL
jgi:uncharacterized protein (DUF1330 family)